MKWNLYGSDRRIEFENMLTPEELKDTLKRYRWVLGQDFGITELLMLMDIKAKVLIGEAINDAPEFLIDQIGKMRDNSLDGTISGELRSIACSLDGLQESR